MPVYIFLYLVKIQKGEKCILISLMEFFCFILLWDSTAFSKGSRVAMSTGGQDETLCSHCSPVAHCLYSFSLEKYIKWSCRLPCKAYQRAVVPTICIHWVLTEEQGCLLHGFPSQDKVKREMARIHIPSALFSLILLQRHGEGTRAEGSLEGWRIRSIHKGSSLYQLWRRMSEGGQSYLNIDRGLHMLICLSWKDWMVFDSLPRQRRIISELKWIFHYKQCVAEASFRRIYLHPC